MQLHEQSASFFYWEALC